ncbi:MAG: hypothetical protein WAN60_22685 [Candidatus Sulfotelmatobacter sp.]
MALTFTNIKSPVGIRDGKTTMANAPGDLAIVTDSSPAFLPKETRLAYLARCIHQSPRIMPLFQKRWVSHPHYREFTSNPVWAAQWWMHFYIPSCMLFHGLANTDSI